MMLLLILLSLISLVHAFTFPGQGSNFSESTQIEKRKFNTLALLRQVVVNGLSANNATNSLAVFNRQGGTAGGGGGSGTGGSLGPFTNIGGVATLLLVFKGILVTMLSSLNTVTIPAIITTFFFLAVASGAVFVICLAADCQDYLGTLVAPNSKSPESDSATTLDNRHTINFEQHYPIYHEIQQAQQLYATPSLNGYRALKDKMSHRSS